MFFTNFLIAQEIEGLGFLKIKQTTLNEVEKKLTEDNYFKSELKDNKAITNVINSPIKAFGVLEYEKKRKLYGPFCYDFKILIISNINIANLDFKKVILEFYKDTLYSIQANSNETYYKALTDKYGNPELDKKTETVYCLHNLTGIERELEEDTYTRMWGDLTKIKIIAILRKYYDDDCKQNVDGYFYINSVDYSELHSECLKKHLDKDKEKVNLDEI